MFLNDFHSSLLWPSQTTFTENSENTVSIDDCGMLLSMNCVWMCNLTKVRGIKYFILYLGSIGWVASLFFMSLNQDNSNDPILGPDLVNSLWLKDFIGLIVPLLDLAT